MDALPVLQATMTALVRGWLVRDGASHSGEKAAGGKAFSQASFDGRALPALTVEQALRRLYDLSVEEFKKQFNDLSVQTDHAEVILTKIGSRILFELVFPTSKISVGHTVRLGNF